MCCAGNIREEIAVFYVCYWQLQTFYGDLLITHGLLVEFYSH